MRLGDFKPVVIPQPIPAPLLPELLGGCLALMSVYYLESREEDVKVFWLV